jgi:hypothetical protein
MLSGGGGKVLGTHTFADCLLVWGGSCSTCAEACFAKE